MLGNYDESMAVSRNTGRVSITKTSNLGFA
jgi:hypothetical protein